MKVKTAMLLIFLIAVSVAGISCGSSKADKITGPSTSGAPWYGGNALDMWSDKGKIAIGDGVIITVKIYNTDGSPISGDLGNYQCDTTGTDTVINVNYSIKGQNLATPSGSLSATIKGSASGKCTEQWSAYYLTFTFSGEIKGTAAITATRFEMQKTIYVDIESLA